MKKLLFTLLLFTYALTAHAQCDFLKDGMALEKQGKYQDAIRKYILAVKDCGKDAVTAMGKINALMLRIEKAERVAKDEAEKAKKALAESEKQKQIATENLQKANKLINAFYFAYDRFALAFKDRRFYFIDKNGDKVEKLGEWEKAEQFEYSGFAKVKKKENEKLLDFLLDTLGNSYRVAYKITDLSPEIKALDLTGTKLDSFPTEILAYTQLAVLILNETYLKTLPTEIGKLQNLKNLQLYSCQLTSLPTQLGELKNLTELDLSSNPLTSLPTQIGELKDLTWLNLSENQLNELPIQIGELRNLASLDLRFNQLNELPIQIGELKNLASLDLSGNQFTTLPVQIGELKNLTELSLWINQLTILPTQIGELKDLTWLNLSENQLTTLPIQIEELRNLASLNLSSNQFTSLPTQLGELKNLISLDLRGNQFTSLPAQLGELKNLTTLGLMSNPIPKKEIDKIRKQLPNCKITHESNLIEQFKSRNYDDVINYYLQNPTESYSEEDVSIINWSYGEVYFLDKKMYDSALICYTKAYEIQEKKYKAKPEDKQSKEEYISILENISAIQLYLKQFSKAEVTALQVLSMKPQDVYAKLRVARAYLFQGKYDQAKQLFLEVKDQKASEDETGRQAALRQLKSMQESGIYHPAVEKIRELLKE
jgi:Leucine-rich repeat (LRR) protein